MAVTVDEALSLIFDHVIPKSKQLLPIELALGHVLAETIIATHNLPPFDNSAMDGYAIKSSDAGKSLDCAHTIFAGDKEEIKLQDSNCIKIMTGARIPHGCEAIVPIEETRADGEKVIMPERIKPAQHIRLTGEDIQRGDLLLEKGERLYAHQITLLASQGISQVRVYKKPRVALFASGSELKMHFEQITDYQLYNTNTPTVLARCQELGCAVQFIGTAVDDLDSIHEHIESALDSDLIITSGGVSVGDADYTQEAFSAFDYDCIFEKIEIKPGKPTTFGRIGNTYVLNLPGNPLAAALIFEIFGQSIINALSAVKEKYLSTMTAKLKKEYTSRPGRNTLVPGLYDGETFEVCDKYAPGMISPLAKSNALIFVDASVSTLEAGAAVKVIPTRFSFNSSEQKSIFTK
ncbi:MAG: molybdopterin molybdotransferase MoeA [Helicobacteraceae bacterium]|jgi:molybdopterin molybdotransferase|nr:molybdopterin molybdotransferase MoeA [Helicobacteraceae bacterium]